MTNEYRNCLQEAREFVSGLGTTVVSDRPAAPFQVQIRSPYYCRVTDAFAGEYISTIRGFDTREEANAFAGAEADDESRITVLPLEHRPWVFQPETLNDELPF